MTRPLIRRFVATLVLLLACSPALAASLSYVGLVERVIDGDTISLKLADGRAIRVRLSEIDAPENGQPFGTDSKRELMRLVAGRKVIARVNDIDRYGRSVARLDRSGVDVNAEMVRTGAAWAYTRYQTDGRFAGWEREARQARRGLWAQSRDKQVAPWDWRAAKRGVIPIATTAAAIRATSREQLAPSSKFSCGKHLCRQMTSCAEAVYTLRQCGIQRLDRDGDGKPCESLCS